MRLLIQQLLFKTSLFFCEFVDIIKCVLNSFYAVPPIHFITNKICQIQINTGLYL